MKSAMGAVWLCLRAELRQQWRAWLALAVLLGLIGGIALTAAAGARRTDTAYPRLLRRSNASHLLVTPARSGFHGYFRAVARLPQVAAADSTMFLQMSLPVRGASPFSGSGGRGSPSGGEGVAIDRVRVLAGRLFNPADPREVMISRAIAYALTCNPAARSRDRVPAAERPARLPAPGAARLQGVGRCDVRRRDRAGHPRTRRTADPAEPGLLPHPAGELVQSRWRRRVCRAAARRRCGRVHPRGHGSGRALPGGERSGRPSVHRVRGDPARHPAAGGRPGDLRRARGADRAGHRRAAAEPPARGRLAGIPHPARAGHEQVSAGRPVPGPGGRRDASPAAPSPSGLPSRRPR